LLIFMTSQFMNVSDISKISDTFINCDVIKINKHKHKHSIKEVSAHGHFRLPPSLPASSSIKTFINIIYQVKTLKTASKQQANYNKINTNKKPSGLRR